MFQLFTKPYDSQNGVIRPPEMEYIKRTYEQQLTTITDYYRSRVYAIKNTHLLSRLLTTGEIPASYDLYRFLEAAYARAPYIAKHFQLTSEITYGHVKPSVFYGEENSEILLYTEAPFDVTSAVQHWTQIQAVTVLEHPFSDLGLLLPTGIKHSTDTGLVVISINIPLLLLQYRQFVLQQQVKLLNGSESLLGVTHFIHMYVLPNMLYSQLELCLMNRCMNLYYGAPMGDALKRHPFYVIDYRDKIDKSLMGSVRRLKKTRMLYFSVLKNLPSIYHEDSQLSLQMPDMAPTRQVWWALLLCRLRIMQFLIDIGGESGIRMNRSLINRLQIDIKRLQDENVYRNAVPDELYRTLTEQFNALVAL